LGEGTVLPGQAAGGMPASGGFRRLEPVRVQPSRGSRS